MKNQIQYISQRCPFDEFYYRTMLDCIEYVPLDSLIYYIWAEPLSNLKSMLDGLNYNSPNVFLFIPDNLSDNNFIVGQNLASYGVQLIIDIAANHPRTNFVLISDVANLHLEGNSINNLKYVDSNLLTMEQSQFQQIPINIKKNFNSDRHVLTLNNRASTSRISLLSYLLGNNMEQYGVLTVSELITNKVNQVDNYLNVSNWKFNLDHELEIKPKLNAGFQKLKKYKYASDQTNNYYRHLVHSDNFTQYISLLCYNSFVEIITESYYEEPSLFVTEKTLQSILGCNFPIIIGSCGSIDYLEQLGFDMFRDIVDHRYDEIIDPVDRLVTAVDLNHRLLTDGKWAKDAWISCQSRFLRNVEFSKKDMYTVIYNRVITQFKAACISIDD